LSGEARLTLVIKEVSSIDTDVRAKFNQYINVKTNYQTVKRRQVGNLSTKSLVSVVSPQIVIQDSDYLETHLVAVPKSSYREFDRRYETLSPMVVPRSATFISQDDEFGLYAVTTFKKHSQDFVHKCREMKWVPRDFKYEAGGREAEEKEVVRVTLEEKKIWGETLRLGRTGWSEAVMAWVHTLVLRVFVETVLRYGLPLDFVCGMLTVSRRLYDHQLTITFSMP
jgi:V-type H+-transporting ATPase subunit C